MGEREPTKETFGRAELPQELREVFQGFGYGRLAGETGIGVVHICHAADGDALGRPGSCWWGFCCMESGGCLGGGEGVLETDDLGI